MVLTGSEIRRMRTAGRLVIEPFDEGSVEQNAYGCRLGDEILEIHPGPDDADVRPEPLRHRIAEAGLVLLPGRFYLGHTAERIGGVDYASELYANLSTASCGMFIQTSAPLGHTGAVIRWTLEIVVTQPLRVYAGARVAKVCFWCNLGLRSAYQGRLYLDTA
jgi:dCTP deaminase